MGKVMVTGAAGFIGSHLCERLVADGHKVIGVDNCSAGSYLNLRSLHTNPSFHFLNGNINFLALDAMKDCEWVFHLADRRAESLDTHDVNVNGTKYVLEKAVEYKVKKFVYAADASCYGIQHEFPTHERAELKPQTPYAFTKMIGEQYVIHWAKFFGLPTVSLRLFNVYGTRDRNSVISRLVHEVKYKQPHNIHGDGEQRRDFVHVDDVVDAFILSAKSDLSGVVLNIGTGRSERINRVVELLGSYSGDKRESNSSGPGITHADVEKSRRLIGYSPKITIEDGCRRMLEATVDPIWGVRPA